MESYYLFLPTPVSQAIFHNDASLIPQKKKKKKKKKSNSDGKV